ncbi:beta-defensin 107A-like [Cynocephalus volans]|uniref:beta-defensin 107A-like n=1 Tax=Cynocephalus volans TaxID=110931 RepID=UPI002FCA6EAB
MPAAMRIFLLIFAVLFLLAQICPASGGVNRRIFCGNMQGRCEAECLSFEVKIGGCRAELIPYCCKNIQKN